MRMKDAIAEKIEEGWTLQQIAKYYNTTVELVEEIVGCDIHELH